MSALSACKLAHCAKVIYSYSLIQQLVCTNNSISFFFEYDYFLEAMITSCSCYFKQFPPNPSDIIQVMESTYIQNFSTPQVCHFRYDTIFSEGKIHIWQSVLNQCPTALPVHIFIK
mmetsp:Transcript_18148/g.61745  ORF Transcript_18148/g.61745 Transcript_18148/m.61745 type:complete len:116 (-) Transcript_18148:926-1273(-)